MRWVAILFFFFFPLQASALSIAASPDHLSFGPLDSELDLYIINPSDEELSFDISTGEVVSLSGKTGTLQPGGRERIVVQRVSAAAGTTLITVSAVKDGVVPGVTIPVTLLRAKQDEAAVKKIIDAKPGVIGTFSRLDSGKKGLLLIMAEVTLGLLCWKYLRNRRTTTC